MYDNNDIKVGKGEMLLCYLWSRIISLEVEHDMLKMYTITFNVCDN